MIPQGNSLLKGSYQTFASFPPTISRAEIRLCAWAIAIGSKLCPFAVKVSVAEFLQTFGFPARSLANLAVFLEMFLLKCRTRMAAR